MDQNTSLLCNHVKLSLPLVSLQNNDGIIILNISHVKFHEFSIIRLKVVSQFIFKHWLY